MCVPSRVPLCHIHVLPPAVTDVSAVTMETDIAFRRSLEAGCVVVREIDCFISLLGCNVSAYKGFCSRLHQVYNSMTLVANFRIKGSDRTVILLFPLPSLLFVCTWHCFPRS